jgi:ketosteroid isomerase-like protein
MRRLTPKWTSAVSAVVLGALAGSAMCAEPAKEAASLAARIQQIEDHIAIERLLLEYGRALDSRDFATYSQLFAENGEWSGSLGTIRGPAAIKATMEEAFKNSKAAPIPTNFHVLTNAIIDVQGDRATAWSKWTFMRIEDGKPVVALAGQYEDTLIREGGQWKFLRRNAQTPGSQATPGRQRQ